MTQRTVNDILTELKSQAIHPFNEEPPPIVINEKDGSPMVLIPAGSFAMGDGLDKESPERTLFLDSYYIGVYAVTNRQYKQFVLATGHRPPCVGARIDSVSIWQGDIYPEEYDVIPVIQINWEDAEAYARWANCQLPSEAQWEKAARGPEGFLYPWGNRWDENNCRNRNNRGESPTASVYAYPEGVSGYGTWNQSGNILEWCSTTTFDQSDSNDEGVYQQERGGCWRYTDHTAFRSSTRSIVVPLALNDFRGFRVVMAVPPH